MTPLRVLSIASEIFPLVKTGGLADVAGALPAALAHEGVEVRTLVPGFPQVLAKLKSPDARADIPRCLAARRESLPRAPWGSISSSLRRPISSSERAGPIWRGADRIAR